MAKEGHNGVHFVWISSHHLKPNKMAASSIQNTNKMATILNSVDMNTDHLNTGNIGIQIVADHLNTRRVLKKTRCCPFVWYSNGGAFRHSNGI